ncbi:hypothetical protein B0H13DRAFT_1877942 [Mycena leptocephala]|nr:hypothetical protein B0H13DRAFT_1877942 [Mycena leptocephala]
MVAAIYWAFHAKRTSILHRKIAYQNRTRIAISLCLGAYHPSTSAARRYQDIGVAVSVSKQALALFVDPVDRATCLHNSGGALQERFYRFGDLGDINESLLVLEDAVVFFPTGHPAKPKCLASFGVALQTCSDRLGDLGDHDQSISVSSEAVQLSRTGKEKSYALVTLGMCLGNRFERLGELEDLNRRFSVYQEAVMSCPDGHPNWMSEGEEAVEDQSGRG